MGRAAPFLVLIALFVPAKAQAATAEGTVVAEPAVRGASIVVPVALTAPSAAALRTAGGTVKLTVRTVRGRAGRLQAGDLRLGDVVRLTGAKRTSATRAKGSTLRVRTRGDAPSFGELDGSLAHARRATQDALAQVDRITAPTVADGIAPDPAGIRAGLLEVRGGVNDRIRDLRAQARGLDAAIGRIGTQQRAAPALAAARDDATRTAAGLDEAVGVLDQRINDVGGLSGVALPIETTSAVSKVLYGILDLLRDAP